MNVKADWTRWFSRWLGGSGSAASQPTPRPTTRATTRGSQSSRVTAARARSGQRATHDANNNKADKSVDVENRQVTPGGGTSLNDAAPRVPSFRPDGLKTINDLPKGWKLVSPSFFSVPGGDSLKNMLAIIDVSGTDHKSTKATHVWLLSSISYGAYQLQHVRSAIRSRGAEVEHSVKVAPELLEAIHDRTEDDLQTSEHRDNDLVRYYERLVTTSINEGISDIHLEIRPATTFIRMRRHGVLTVHAQVSNEYGMRLATVIHNVLADKKAVTFRAGEPQAASVDTILANTAVKIRYQSMPAYPGDGLDVVMRVLPIGADDEEYDSLEKLGYAKEHVDMLLESSSQPVGALVIAGTTGSGKSTTLKNLLMYINEHREYRCKIYTVEDPPEYKIPRVTQVPVQRDLSDSKDELSPFYKPLTAAMRADPDILMIGEVRDNYTADGMKKATQSGHQVLTTIHASSAIAIVPRLLDLGLTPNILGSPEFISALVYQKLLQVLCQHCAVPLVDAVRDETDPDGPLHKLFDRLKNAYGINDLDGFSSLRLRGGTIDGQKCKSCGGLGVTGRTVCAEIIQPDFQMLEMFRNLKDIEVTAYWRSLSDQNPLSTNMRGKTALDHALLKVWAGQVSVMDLEELLGRCDSTYRYFAFQHKSARSADDSFDG